MCIHSLFLLRFSLFRHSISRFHFGCLLASLYIQYLLQMCFAQFCIHFTWNVFLILSEVNKMICYMFVFDQLKFSTNIYLSLK